MLQLRHILFMIIFGYSKISSQVVVPCIPAQKCITLDGTDVKCSSYGKCFYDVLSYMSNKTKSFQTCICDEGYTDLNENVYVKCCYKRKSQFMAIILEFLLGFGLGHVYLENYLLGLIKFITFTLFCCSCCIIGFCFCYREDSPNSISTIEDQRNVYYEKNEELRIRNPDHPLKIKIFNKIMLFSIYGYLLWQLVDGILMGLNLYKDGYGITPMPW